VQAKARLNPDDMAKRLAKFPAIVLEQKRDRLAAKLQERKGADLFLPSWQDKLANERKLHTKKLTTGTGTRTYTKRLMETIAFAELINLQKEILRKKEKEKGKEKGKE